jgi:methanogenic corrinoid protein MtbC1
MTAVYTVKHAAELTGIPADTLRMWERRYGVVTPVRSEGGYRLYDDAAIARLNAMQALVEAGWSPRRAALQVSSGTTLGRPDLPDVEADESDGDDDAAGEDLDLLVRLAVEFDGDLLRTALDEVFARADLDLLLDSWLMPALLRLGRAWRRGEVSVAAEHLVSAGVHRRLASALDAVASAPGAPVVVVALPRGSRHELGVLAFSVLLARQGITVSYLGGDVPAESLVVASTSHDPAAVVLGVPSSDDVPAVRDTVAALTAARPGLPVLLGGGHQDEVGAGEVLGHSLGDGARRLARRLTAA